jgi:hypothetical protein
MDAIRRYRAPEALATGQFAVSSDDPFPVPLLRSSELTAMMYGCIGAERRSSYIIYSGIALQLYDML